MAALVRGYEESGLTRQEYCAAQGIALTALDYYRRRGKKKAGLVAVKVEGTMAGLTMAVVVGNGRRIEVTSGFVEEELARLVRIVERV